MISTHVRAVTHQTTKHSLSTKEKLTSPERKFFMGIKFFPDQDSPGFTGTVCLEDKAYLGKGCKALWESVRDLLSSLLCNEPGCGAPHLPAPLISQSAPLTLVVSLTALR